MRCKLVQEWEKENGITSKDKRNSHEKLKGKRKKKERKKTPTSLLQRKGKKKRQRNVGMSYLNYLRRRF